MRVLVLAFYHGLGHVVRATRVSEELQRTGVEVLVATAAAATHIPASRGLPSAELHELPPIQADAPPPTPGAPLRLADPDYLRACLKEERALIRSFEPDFVLVDFRVTGSVSAALEGVPSGWIVNTGFFGHPFPDVLSDVVPQLIEIGVDERIARRILGEYVYIPDWSLFDPLSSIENEASRAALWEVNEVRHVGPVMKASLADRPTRGSARQRLGVPEHRPLVVVSLGGTAQGYPALKALSSLLGQVDATTVVLTGPNIDPALIDTSEVDYVFSYTEDALMWSCAADLVVTHGGHTSTMEAIAVGTPLLALPGHEEQRWNAGRAVRWEVGEILDQHRIDSDAVAVIERLLSDESLALRAAALADRLADFDGARALADHVRQTITLSGRSWSA